MNRPYLRTYTDDELRKIAAQLDYGALPGTPIYGAAIQARGILIERGLLQPAADDTQEAPTVPREAYED